MIKVLTALLGSISPKSPQSYQKGIAIFRPMLHFGYFEIRPFAVDPFEFWPFITIPIYRPNKHSAFKKHF